MYFKRRVERHFSSKMKRKSRDWDLTLELSCHAGCPTEVVVCVLSKGCLAPTFVRAKQVKYVVIRTQTQMSRNKSIDDDDVDLLQLDVQE
jgi:hypothetical protein